MVVRRDAAAAARSGAARPVTRRRRRAATRRRQRGPGGGAASCVTARRGPAGPAQPRPPPGDQWRRQPTSLMAPTSLTTRRQRWRDVDRWWRQWTLGGGQSWRCHLWVISGGSGGTCDVGVRQLAGGRASEAAETESNRRRAYLGNGSYPVWPASFSEISTDAKRFCY